jgi:dynein heavy chain 2
MREQYEHKTLFEFFVSRVKKYLSVVVNLDCKHPKFQQNCAQNPSLFNKCIVLWNESWSKDSERKVAYSELEDVKEILGDKFE